MLFAQIRQSRKAVIEADKVDYAKPKELEIAEIKVEGMDFLDPNTLISLTGLKVGDRVNIPGQQISDAIKRLWKHGLVDNVTIYKEKIEAGKIYLIIGLTERPRLRKFEFSGVNRTQEKELTDNISLYRGKVLTDAIVKNTELMVSNYFIDKGYLNTEVKVRQKRDTVLANHVILAVDIDKKSKVKVNDVIINGNKEISATKLKKKMKKTGEAARFTLLNNLARELFSLTPRKVGDFLTSSKDMNSGQLKTYINDNVKLNIFKPGKHVKAEYKEDKKSLIAYYNSKGYRDAMVQSDSIYRVSDNRINIKINIEEGNKYYYRDIYWTGNYVYSDDVLGRALGVSKGTIYNREELDKKLNFNPQGTDISGLYLDNGYLFFRIDPVEWVEGDSIDIEMRMFEGTQATVNKVTINGNDRTNDHVILRELRTVPGQKFSRQNIIRDNQQLAQLGYFDPEQIDIRPEPNASDGTVDMVYNLVERPSDQVELSGGWGGYYGFVGTLGLSFNNFSLRNIPKFDKWRPLPIGDGQKFSIRAQANGRAFQNYSLTFVEPWLGGKKPNSLSVSLNNSIQRQINPFTREVEGSLDLRAITLGFGKRMNWPDNYFTFNESLSYTVYGFENWTFNSLGFSDGTSKSLTLTTSIARNSVDNPMYPRSGSSVQLSLSLTPPWSLWQDIDYENAEPSEKYALVEYHKWMFDLKHYVALVGDLVFESRAHFGFIGSYTKEAGVGPFERFFLGGDGLAGGFNSWLLGTEVIGLRGYENNVITPPNYGLPGTPLTADEIEGGTIFNKFSFELRYPVTTGQAATIYVLGYAEAGNNWNNFKDFDPFNLYRTAGFGARIFMPAFGLIGLNWGYGFDTLPGRSEPSGPQFHFTIGQQLR
jgi:outer membrane protein insertion porin family